MIRDRRSTQRLDSCPFIYLAVAPDNGGILLNLSTTGLALQAMAPLRAAQQVQLQMDLPGSETRIATKGEVVWTDASGELAGVRLLNLTANSQEQIRCWIASQRSLNALSVLPLKRKEESNEPRAALQEIDEAEEKQKSWNDSSSLPDKQDEVGHLRSAVLQSTTSEPQTKSLASRVVALVHRPSAKHRLMAAITVVVLAFIVVAAELTYYVHQGAFDEISNLLDLNGPPESGTPGPAMPKTLRKPQKPDHPRGSNHRTKPIMRPPAGGSRTLVPQPSNETGVAAIAPPLGFTSSFLVRGNNQVLMIPAHVPTLNRSGIARNTPPEKATVRVFSEFAGHPPQKYEPPSYPELALETDTEGSVVVQATVDEEGVVREVNVLSGNALLASAVADAVRRWKYKPYVDNGKPLGGDVLVKVTFAISKN